MDKAKKLAEQAQQKLDEAQHQFNQSASPQAGGQGGGAQYDEHGRPIQQAPPAGETPPPQAQPAQPAPSPQAPPPDPTAGFGPPDASTPTSTSGPAAPSEEPAPPAAEAPAPAEKPAGGGANATPDPFKPLDQ
jgi:hypothetical protein